MDSVLGMGIYTLDEVARYTGATPHSVRRWCSGASPLFVRQHPKMGAWHPASFHNLVEVLVAKRLKAVGVSTQSLRRAVTVLREELATPVPFCRREILTDGRKLFIRVAEHDDDPLLYELFSRQHHFDEVMHDHLRGVRYNDGDLADRWDILPGITLDPDIRFGQPVVTGTRIPAETLYRVWMAEGHDENSVAEAYEVSSDTVLAAVSFGEKYILAA